LEPNPSSSPSFLGTKLTRTGKILRDGASSQIQDYQERFLKVANLYNLLFKDLIVENFDNNLACITASKFFEKLLMI
jgi:hypothetical protein